MPLSGYNICITLTGLYERSLTRVFMGEERMIGSKKPKVPKKSAPLMWLSAVAIMILVGAGYRILAASMKSLTQKPINLPVPITAFPFSVGNWSGEDIPVPENIQRVSGNDEFLNRLYINRTGNQWANVYIAYSARPRTMLGHRPQVCYVGAGWVHDSTELLEFFSRSSRPVSSLLHHFHKPAPSNEEIVVLSFYILNGQIISKEKGFSGIGWRTPNIAGDVTRYVAQVQISSVLEDSIRRVAEEMTDVILDFFPDEDGSVRSFKYIEAQSGR